MADNIANIFNGDAFSLTTLTAYINTVPVQPMKFGDLLEWDEKGVNTLNVSVEEQEGKIRVLQSSERGSPAQSTSGKKRKARLFNIPHYTEEAAVHASEVQGVRQFGSTDVFETVEGKRNEKLAVMRTNHEVTHEFARAGAIRGVLLDADGSVIQDWHAADGFNVARTEKEIDLTDTSLDLRTYFIQCKRLAEAQLGGYIIRGYKGFLPPEIFDAICQHPSVYKMYQYYLEGAQLRSDDRKGFKIVDGVELFSYDNGTLNGVEFLPNDTGFLVPDVAGLFKARYAPADTLETANTIGLPFYAMTTEVTPRAAKMESESNALFFCEKPQSIVNIKLA